MSKEKRMKQEKSNTEERHHKEGQHEYHHNHPEGVACVPLKPKTSKLDRAIMLILAIILASVFMKPFLSYQSTMRGYSYTELGETSKAIKHLKRAVSLAEKNATAWSLLAYNLNKEKKYSESEEAYEKALKYNPDDVQAAIEYALIKIYKREYDEAIDTLTKHLPEEEIYVDGWILLGAAYEKKGDAKSAIETYRKIYEKIDPGNQVAKDKLSQYNSL